MAQQVRIFTAQLRNKPGNTVDPAEDRAEALRRLDDAVNQCLQQEAGGDLVDVECLQSSAACKFGSFTQLTVIVRFIRREE